MSIHHRISLLAVIVILAAAGAAAQIPAAERAALIALYNSTNGDSWSDNTGWKDGGDFAASGTECSWFGVTCDGTPNVTMVNLSGNGLTGTLPPELGDLDEVIHLWLHINQISGELPPELAEMDTVFWVMLDRNNLTGTIPPEYGGFAAISGLFLDENQLSGSIPSTLGSLTTLVDLNLNDNLLSGSIPPELADIPTLEKIWLYNNELTGEIPPELGSLSTLKFLGLRNNHLEGPIPPQLGDLANLLYLGLQSNNIQGEIPVEILDLTALPPGGYGMTLGWNGLSTTDPAVKAFVDSSHYYIGGYLGTWESTQTVGLEVISVDSIHDTTVWLDFEPIEYSDQWGDYEFWFAPTGTEDWTKAGWTWSKNDTIFPVTGLEPGTTYDFKSFSFTSSHQDNRNEIWIPSDVVVTATTSSTGCSAPEIVVPIGQFPKTLSLTETYSTYDWVTGDTDPTLLIDPQAILWYWVELGWGGPCVESAITYINPWEIFPDDFETGTTIGWSRVIGGAE